VHELGFGQNSKGIQRLDMLLKPRRLGEERSDHAKEFWVSGYPDMHAGL
jgi:hypothetical protein